MSTNEQILEVMQELCEETSSCIRCSCGTMHFCRVVSNEDIKGVVEDFEELLEKAKKHPTGYVIRDDDSFAPYMKFNNETIVAGCRCEKDLRIGWMLLSERSTIASFFDALSPKKGEEADECEEVQGKIKAV